MNIFLILAGLAFVVTGIAGVIKTKSDRFVDAVLSDANSGTWPEIKRSAPDDRREDANGVREKVVRDLRERWGSGAQIYWNETGIVVIAEDGYVSEFEVLTGTSRHFGMLPPNRKTEP